MEKDMRILEVWLLHKVFLLECEQQFLSDYHVKCDFFIIKSTGFFVFVFLSAMVFGVHVFLGEGIRPWFYKQLWAAICVLGIEPESS